jgi:uncharacterized protein YkwD
MEPVARRTLILTGIASFLPRISRAQEARERLAERLISEAVNLGRARLAPGLPAFVSDPMLDEIARERSHAMARGAPFDHGDGHGGYPAIEMIRAHYSRFGAMGENIMMEFDPAGEAYQAKLFAARAVKSWFDSEGHRDNILSSAFTRCGTGVAAARTTVYATQVFWGPPAARRTPQRD